MIPKDTVEKIYDALRIEEVISDFVSLKKKGADYKACCPFHNEKTPSFSVSTSKGIYKCFGCGEGGNAIDFVMKHEQFTYVEALKHIAQKYGIEIQERKLSQEEQERATEKEALQIVTTFACNYFKKNLFESEEGKEKGLSYLRNRGFTDQTIEQFGLGYALNEWNVFTDYALEEGYKLEYLKQAGLTKEKADKHYDGLRGRVIFPIMGISGKCIGFGARILIDDKKAPKYINSPENALYVKNKVLYGIYEAKKAIVKKDVCYLVEGYTDVISFFQAGIENVVASSGTSLTEGQINLVKRFTKNITIVYDGDVAGIKASFRGIDLILKQGLNVKIVLLPEGQDPDSMAKTMPQEDLQNFIDAQSKDFIVFKTELLKEETKDDPIKKAALIHQIIDSVALIPDQITRSLYIQQTAVILEIDEAVLLSELNKALRKKHFSTTPSSQAPLPNLANMPSISNQDLVAQQPYVQESKKQLDAFELDVFRLLLNYGNQSFKLKKEEQESVVMKDFLMAEIQKDALVFEEPLIQKGIEQYLSATSHKEALDAFYTSNDLELKDLVIELTQERYALSDWERKNILVNTEDKLLKRAALECVYAFKGSKIDKMIADIEVQLKTESLEDQMISLQKVMVLKELRKKIKLEIGRPI